VPPSTVQGTATAASGSASRPEGIRERRRGLAVDGLRAACRDSEIPW
jgi:hypothetical protein